MGAPLISQPSVENSQSSKTETPGKRHGSLRIFARDKKGSSSIEYGLLAALVSIVMINSMQAVGSGINSLFKNVSHKVESTKNLKPLSPAPSYSPETGPAPASPMFTPAPNNPPGNVAPKSGTKP